MNNLVLTGFMGTGKTSVGRVVAHWLGRPFVDMDAVIEARAGKSIARIFAEDGEETFRGLESDLCYELSQQRNLVIATGGGTLVKPANRTTMATSSIIVCLQAKEDEILRRVGQETHRPLLRQGNARAAVERLLAERRAAYATIPWQVDTTGLDVEAVASRVVELATTHTLHVTHSSGTYDIHIGRNILRYLGGALRAAGIAEGTRIAVVTNETVAPLYAEAVRETLSEYNFPSFVCTLPDGEKYKTLETVQQLYEWLLEGDLDRTGVVLALGGGVVGDVAGFAAATYMRGVRFVQVPTSLLAMTDASVGAKTGVDLRQGKNLVGAFKQPELVFVDLAVLDTLPEAEIRSGLAEVLKHGIIRDPQLFDLLAERFRRGEFLPTPEILGRSVQVKVDIVEQDLLEQGQRALLNLGHTTGHALEQLSGYTLRHGEAVAIGIVVAARIAVAIGWAQSTFPDHVAEVLRLAALPVRCPAWPAEHIMAAMQHDKKRHGKNLRWVLPREVGKVAIAEDVPRSVVRAVLIEMGAKG